MGLDDEFWRKVREERPAQPAPRPSVPPRAERPAVDRSRPYAPIAPSGQGGSWIGVSVVMAAMVGAGVLVMPSALASVNWPAMGVFLVMGWLLSRGRRTVLEWVATWTIAGVVVGGAWTVVSAILRGIGAIS